MVNIYVFIALCETEGYKHINIQVDHWLGLVLYNSQLYWLNKTSLLHMMGKREKDTILNGWEE